VAINFNRIPKELKTFNQWVLTEQGTKEPYPVAGDRKKRASCNDPDDWSTFENATNALGQSERFCGIAYSITRDDSYAIMDLDKAFVSGELTEQARDIIKRLDSYTEKSLSGNGIHIIVTTSNNDVFIDDPPVEVYSRSHFMTLTGDIFDDRDTIHERQSELESIIKDYCLIKEPKPTTANIQPIHEHSNKDIEFICDRELQKAVSKAIVGNRHNTGLDLACQLRDNRIAYDRAEDTMSKYQSTVPQDVHNYTLDEARKTLRSVYDDTPREPSYQKKEYDKSNKAGDIRVIEDTDQKPIKPFNLTDYGNAERLVHYHGEDIRYCEPLKSWFIWDGKRWKLDDSLAIDRLAKETVRRIYTEASYCDNDDQRKAIADHAKRSEANNKIQAMVALARSESDVIIRSDNLDRDGFLLNCENGTIDLRTGELLPHRKENNITKIIPVSYDRMAEYPKWERFLNEIFSGDQELIRFIKYSVGYSLTNSINEQCFFICYGTGANGKSVFLDTIEYILGEYGRRVNPITFEDIYKNSGPREDIAGLKQIRYISTIETGQGRRLAENLLKQMTGDSTIRARFLYQNSFEFEQTYKIWIATNHKPGIRGTDEGIWRRVRLIPFEFTIEPEKQNKNLRDELREEAPGILQWAVEGCITWLGTGLHCVTPQKVKSATDTYRQEMDTIRAFIAECCVLGYDKQVKVTDLHNAYLEWSGDRISRKEFNRKIEDLGYKKEKLPAGIFWIGVGLYNEQTII